VAVQVRDRFHPGPPSGAWYQRLGCQRGCHRPVLALGACLGSSASTIRSQSEGLSAPTGHLHGHTTCRPSCHTMLSPIRSTSAPSTDAQSDRQRIPS
jgi:hypothetical protein